MWRDKVDRINRDYKYDVNFKVYRGQTSQRLYHQFDVTYSKLFGELYEPKPQK